MNIGKFRVPAYLVVAFTFAVEIAFLILFCIAEVQVPPIVPSLNLAWYVIICIFMSVFYVVTATRIFRALYRRFKVSSRNAGAGTGSTDSAQGHQAISNQEQAGRDKLRDVTMKLSGCALCLIIIVIMATLTFAPFYSPPSSHAGYFAYWFILHSVVNLKALATVLSFQPPRQTVSATSRTSVPTSPATSQRFSVSAGGAHSNSTPSQGSASC